MIAELLQRTTFELDAAHPRAGAEGAAASLRRVPGVLLADVDASGRRIDVSHDGGVALQSMLGAVASSGVRSIAVGDWVVQREMPAATRGAAMIPAAARDSATLEGARMVCILALAALAVLDLALPSVDGHAMLLALGAWSVVYAGLHLRKS